MGFGSFCCMAKLKRMLDSSASSNAFWSHHRDTTFSDNHAHPGKVHTDMTIIFMLLYLFLVQSSTTTTTYA
jgi:hypothetical protein